MPLIHEFTEEDLGSIDVMGYVLMVTVLALGGVVGLSTVRNGIVQEYGDIAWALRNLDQSHGFLPDGSVGPDTFLDCTPGDFVQTNNPNGLGYFAKTGYADSAAGQAPPGFILTGPVSEGDTLTVPTNSGVVDDNDDDAVYKNMMDPLDEGDNTPFPPHPGG